MDQDSGVTTFAVCENSRCLLAKMLDSDTAMTLIALVSEDPANWEEALSAWSRYRTPVVCEFPSSLPLEEVDRATAIDLLRDAEAWSVIDFKNSRILTGGQFPGLERDMAFAMVVDEAGKQHCPLSIHLPPWWELHERVAVDAFDQPRNSPIKKPIVNRDVLYGNPLVSAIAAAVLETFRSPAWQESAASKERQDFYPFTVAVHRDWLMTPRADLDGRMPRELLHGAVEWIDRVTGAHQMRFEDDAPMVALPDDWSGYATAPMGREEMCIYFDLCREVIGSGWDWCESDSGKLTRHDKELALSQLTQFLRDIRDEWLENSFEGGSSPSFIIECCRRRVPRGSGVIIEGIEGVEGEQHLPDCDCPICEMMAEGLFGVSFSHIDGYQLETDNEFAFSMCETREEWEQQQREAAEFSEYVGRKVAEREAAGDFDTDDPFVSAWSGIGDDRPIAGDRGNYLKFAFLVAEIVSSLEHLNADHEDIQRLNRAFADYRHADATPQAAQGLNEILEEIGKRYPELVSKSADLQSRIVETARAAANDWDNESPL